ncbi:MAG: isoprenylcysteine carboxylmethyltransferase family protein [Acidobacteria bacterium]|nr:isoprenylcysteine carboxylmethyltransferase family protein [Acidobacteriota bacterium]
MKRLELAVHPPIIFMACATIMILAERFMPGLAIGIPFRHHIAAALALVAIAVASLALLQFTRSRTTIDPRRPEEASLLVVGGIYRLSRNPMYLALLIALTALAVLLDNWISLAIVPLLPVWLTRFQIVPEERILSSRFGAEFEKYRARTRRWL